MKKGYRVIVNDKNPRIKKLHGVKGIIDEIHRDKNQTWIYVALEGKRKGSSLVAFDISEVDIDKFYYRSNNLDKLEN